jgi:tRNA (guanosine-2'-O-)-methyltransferase
MKSSLMSAELIDYLSGFVNKRRLEYFDKVLEYRTRYINLVCEDIFQSHNANALIRTCDCFGIQDIHIIENRNVFEVNPEVALGASNWVTIHRHNQLHNNPHTLFDDLRSSGYRIIATTPRKYGISLQEIDLAKGPVSLVFGTEKDGLSPTVRQEADEYITIDMFGFTRSFNVSVSAGIVLHYLRLKLSESSNIDWRLEDKEKQMLKLDWLKKSIRRSDLIVKEFWRKNNLSGMQ